MTTSTSAARSEASPQPATGLRRRGHIARQRRALLELGVALAVGVAPNLFYAIMYYLHGLPVTQGPMVDDWSLIVRSLQVAAAMLFLIAVSREGWAHLGITRPSWNDAWEAIALGALALAANMGVTWALFRLAGKDPESFRIGLPSHFDLWLTTLLIGADVCNALAEELTMRAVVQTRLTRLLGSARWAIAISALLFGGYHIYHGIESAVGIVAYGLIFGTYFAIRRRFWPLVAAHAATNVAYFLFLHPAR